MTPQQAAEKKYPYKESYDITFEKVFDANKEKRIAYAQALTDQPQLSRSVLEEVRERCANILTGVHLLTKYRERVLKVNLDDLLPVGDGWINVIGNKPEPGTEVLCQDVDGHVVCEYIDGEFRECYHWDIIHPFRYKFITPPQTVNDKEVKL